MGHRLSKRLNRSGPIPAVEETAVISTADAVNTAAKPEAKDDPIEFIDGAESSTSSPSLLTSLTPQASSISEPKLCMTMTKGDNLGMALIPPSERHLHVATLPPESIRSQKSGTTDTAQITVIAPQLLLLTRELIYAIWEVSRRQGAWGFIRAWFWLMIAITEGVWTGFRDWMTVVIPP
ncbi:hypothetical protein RUND412_005229 [Rhizina undulata]